ncbi:MAG: AarF/UbiB family protein [Leptospiraceae bacterium]|nr:AarF/UbiB family protein [Leptospiraceae bacterium]
MKNNDQTGSEPSEDALKYHKKSHRIRFYIVYFFVLKWSWRFLWHQRFRKRFSSQETVAHVEEFLYRKLAIESKHLFLKLGGVYIKAGQFLSNMGHLLPPVILDSLKDLQDRVPPRPFPEIRERFYREFGKNIEEIFPDIEKYPLASASTAQVHTATLNGKKIAIKILYPGIESLVQKDLVTILFVLRWINRFLFEFQYQTIHKEISSIIHEEMDLSREGKSIKRMADLFENEKDYVFPHVYDEYTKKGILVTRFIEGVKITETRINKSGSKKSRPLDLLVKAYILMIFRFRFFHADPHSGNVIYTPQGKLCFIDFGAVAEIPQTMSQGLKKLVVSALNQDYFSLIEAMEEIGFFDSTANKEKLEKVAKFALEKLKRFVTDVDFFQNISLDQLKPEDAFIFLEGINASLRELMKVVQVPNNYVMLERVFGILVGTGAVLDPYRTILDYSEPHFASLVEKNKKEISEILRKEGNEIGVSLLELPRELHKAIITLQRGRIQIQNPAQEKHTEKIYALGHEFIFAIFFLGGIYFGNEFLKLELIPVSIGFYLFSAISGWKLFQSFQKNRTKKF